MSTQVNAEETANRPYRVFKITTRDDWMSACRQGYFHGSNDDIRDGFIHLSGPHQVRGTLEKYFKSQEDLLLIAFQTQDFGPDLKWEVSRGGELFPHLYTPLNTGLAMWSRPLVLGPQDIPVCDEAWLIC
jgi:uncharacterized protein (DUF952 family)